MEIINDLLIKCNEIVKREGRPEEEFNLFTLLDVERREVQTHSAFIAELLNPQGRHQKGTLFLGKFLKEIKLENKLDFDRVIVQVEHPIGDDGRLDILIHDRTTYLAIENKIDAQDQDKQLLRYYNWLTDNGHKKDAYGLYYLTLHGGYASKKSTGGQKFEYEPISYKKHITNWLEDCMKEEKLSKNTTLYHAIAQYLLLVKKITGQSMNEGMEQKIKEQIQNNLVGAEQIYKLYWNAIKEGLSGFAGLIGERLDDTLYNVPLDGDHCYFDWGENPEGLKSELVLWVKKKNGEWLGVANGVNQQFYMAHHQKWDEQWQYFNEALEIKSFKTDTNLVQIQAVIQDPKRFEKDAALIANELNEFGIMRGF